MLVSHPFSPLIMRRRNQRGINCSIIRINWIQDDDDDCGGGGG